MQLNIISLFPKMIEDALSYGVIGRAIEQGLLDLRAYDLRKFANNKHNTVDDRPFGGGAGMVMMYDVLLRAWQAVQQRGNAGQLFYLSPQGKTIDQAVCNRLAELPSMTLLCGRYEGVDQRFIDQHVDQELSIGDYVISGGELAACVLIDAIGRQINGVLGDQESAQTDSFMDKRLAAPQFTRSEILGQTGVPAVLLSGNHQQIAKWRDQQSALQTKRKRPDLLAGTSGGEIDHPCTNKNEKNNE